MGTMVLNRPAGKPVRFTGRSLPGAQQNYKIDLRQVTSADKFIHQINDLAMSFANANYAGWLLKTTNCGNCLSTVLRSPISCGRKKTRLQAGLV